MVIVKRRSLQDSLLSWRVRSLKRWFWKEKMTNNIISLRAMFYRKRVVKFLRWGHHCLLQNITFPIKRVGVQKCLSELFSFWRVKNFSKTRCETNVQECYFFDRRCFPERGWWSFWDEVTTVCLHPINWSGHNNHIGDNCDDDKDDGHLHWTFRTTLSTTTNKL